MDASAQTLSAPGAAHTWDTMEAGEVLQTLDVDRIPGLSAAEATARVARYGPNRFTAMAAEPRFKAFLRQYADPMQIVLLVAGVVSL